MKGRVSIPTSEAQKKAMRKYESKNKRVPLVMPMSWYETIKQAADSLDESVSHFIKVTALNRALATLQSVKSDNDNRDLSGKSQAGGQTGHVD